MLDKFYPKYEYTQLQISNLQFINLKPDRDVHIRVTRRTGYGDRYKLFVINKDKFKEIQSILKKPILIEMWDKQTNYFITKIEFSVNDSTNKAATLATVQIDVESAKRFGIVVHDGNEESYPIILHCSPTGSIERVLCGLLERLT